VRGAAAPGPRPAAHVARQDPVSSATVTHASSRASKVRGPLLAAPGLWAWLGMCVPPASGSHARPPALCARTQGSGSSSSSNKSGSTTSSTDSSSAKGGKSSNGGKLGGSAEEPGILTVAPPSRRVSVLLCLHTDQQGLLGVHKPGQSTTGATHAHALHAHAHPTHYRTTCSRPSAPPCGPRTAGPAPMPRPGRPSRSGLAAWLLLGPGPAALRLVYL